MSPVHLSLVSIFKPLVVAAALEENVINTNTTFLLWG